MNWIKELWNRATGAAGRDAGLRSLALQSGTPFGKGSGYYAAAEPHIDEQWSELIWPWIDGLDFRRVMDLAAGHGRNSVKLAEVAGAIVLVDINPECLEACRERLGSGPRFTYVQTDGYTLADVPDASVTLVYSFDAMVHFDPEVIRSYLPEIHRVLEPGGYGFCHHSNYTGNPGGDFRDAPHWRNHMSVELFGTMCESSGLEVVRSEPIAWGRDDDVVTDLDGLTLFRKP